MFEGYADTVHSTRGRLTLYLDYEAYEEMALNRSSGRTHHPQLWGSSRCVTWRLCTGLDGWRLARSVC